MDKKQVLIVEDDSIFRNYLYQVLKYDYEVTAVANPLEAMDEIRRTPYDLMITDLRMPEMDGRELVQRVHREMDPYLMVIVITAFEGDWPIDDALATHVFRYLRKGAFLPSELKQNVNKALEMRSSLMSLQEYQRQENAAENIYRDIFVNSEDAFFVVDMQGRPLAFNSGFETLLEYKYEELKNGSLYDLLPEGIADYVRETIRAKIKKDAYAPLNLTVRLKSGRELEVEVWLRIVGNVGNLPEAVFGFVRKTDSSGASQQEQVALLNHMKDQLMARSAELQGVQGRFERLAAHVHDIVIWFDDMWQCEYYNPGKDNLLGYSVDQAVGRQIPWDNIIHAEDLYLKDEFLEVITNKKPYFAGTIRVYSNSRRFYYFSFEAFFHYDSQGSFDGVDVVAQDVTQRMVAEQELRKANLKIQEFNDRLSDNVGKKIRELKESQERYQHIVEDSSDVIISVNMDGRVTYMNRKGLETLGVSLDEIRGRSYHEFLSNEKSDERLKELSRIVKDSDSPELIDILVDTTEGQRTWRVTMDKLVGVHGSEIICVARDITGEIAKSKRLKLLANIEHYTMDAIIGLDNERRIISWNHGATRIFGWEENESIGKTAFMIIPDDVRDEAEAVLEEVREKGFVKDLETRRITKAGKIIDVSLTITALKDSKGNLFGFSTIIKDITEHKKMEKALIQSERLAATGKLSASIAHEINNPLYGIRSCLHHVLSSNGEDVDKQFVKLAIKETDRIADLIRNMKTFYMPSEGKMQQADINELIREVLTFNRKYLEENRVRLDFAKGESISAECVPDQLKQVFINLMTNAVEAMPDGGMLTVVTRSAADGKSISVDFKDTGVGIAEEDIAHIFDMFYTKKPKVKGVGLGLSVSYGIVRRHGGTVDVRRRSTQGTCFTVTLPVKSMPGKQLKLDLV